MFVHTLVIFPAKISLAEYTQSVFYGYVSAATPLGAGLTDWRNVEQGPRWRIKTWTQNKWPRLLSCNFRVFVYISVECCTFVLMFIMRLIHVVVSLPWSFHFSRIHRDAVELWFRGVIRNWYDAAEGHSLCVHSAAYSAQAVGEKEAANSYGTELQEARLHGPRQQVRRGSGLNSRPAGSVARCCRGRLGCGYLSTTT